MSSNKHIRLSLKNYVFKIQSNGRVRCQREKGGPSPCSGGWAGCCCQGLKVRVILSLLRALPPPPAQETLLTHMQMGCREH